MRFLYPLLLVVCCSFTAKDLTLEEKIGQMLIVHFNGATVNEHAEKLVREAHAGAFIYYIWSNGLTDPQQIKTLSQGLQALAAKQPHPIPLLITTDQEGDRVTRLTNGFVRFPSNGVIGATQSPTVAYAVAFTMGTEMANVGINMNLAPVVDVNSNPANKVIGNRSFGSDPELVAQFGLQAIRGYRAAGVIATLKHFPGYGEAAVDPHESLPVVRKAPQEIEQVELRPYFLLADDAEALMTAHILMPELDPNNCATFSSLILQDILRKKIGFKGVMISDSLVMEGLLKQVKTVDEAAIKAVLAGHDMLILGGKQLLHFQHGTELTPNDVVRIHKSLVDAVRSGQIPEEQVNASVDRILLLKDKYFSNNGK